MIWVSLGSVKEPPRFNLLLLLLLLLLLAWGSVVVKALRY